MAHQTPSAENKDRAQAHSQLYITSSQSQSQQRPASQTLRHFAATADSAAPYISPYPPTTASNTNSREESVISERISSHRQHFNLFVVSQASSIYSSAGSASEIMSAASKTISGNEKAQLIRSLQTHKVNTLTELRRIEKIFASANATDTTEPMTSAWTHYVNSNNLLSELRALTKNYPFSSECLDEAKWQVIGDPASTRSWNYCWLVLTRIRKEGLIPTHARQLAVKPAMWGGRTPTAAGVEKLASACVSEWTRALDQLLRNWTTPPSLTGR